MPRYDFTTQRLFIDAHLAEGVSLELDRGQANYLLNVLRLKAGDSVLLFNGRDGEWLAAIEAQGRKKASLVAREQIRPQTPVPDLIYIFAPLKQARMEYMVQKAVEMGAGTLQPVITQHTQQRKVNIEKMRAYSVEAAEQCGILVLPDVREPMAFDDLLTGFDSNRRMIFCDEGAANQNPLVALKQLGPGDKLAVLIGPEGGFSETEREKLHALPFVTAIPLGPRVLRADTAAVAALAVVQAALGDWAD